MSLLSRLTDLLEQELPPAGQRQMRRERSVQCISPHGLHRMAYVEWGKADNPRVLICVHGLTRNGRDFDDLARGLADEYRVVCPDVVGRGRSDWLGVKGSYGFPQYMADMMTLIARLDVEEVHWLGTSMGGLIGMLLASLPHSPIRRLVLNDVGPVIAAAALARIGEYVGRAPRFASMDEAEAYVRAISAPFGPLTDEQWRHLTRYSVRPLGEGEFCMIYDPALGDAFRAQPEADIELWAAWDRIRCPTLAIRGSESDLLSRETLHEMACRGPQASVVEIAGIGHAPMLMDAVQIELVRSFLLADETELKPRDIPACKVKVADADGDGAGSATSPD